MPGAGVAVSFGTGRRPEAATVVRVGGPAVQAGGPQKDVEPVAFEGPLALLLSLIEARQLDVMSVPLGGLAGAYLEAMATLEGERLPYLSSFIAVAAQLILIKSRALLPRPPAGGPLPLENEGVDPEAELRRRLVEYRAYRDAGQWLAARASAGLLVRREPAVAQASGLAGAWPGPEAPLDTRLLADALAGLARLAPPPVPPPEVVRRDVTLAERAAVIREAVRGAPVVVLQTLIEETADRVVAAVTFLAMLELVKRREIAVEQDRPWGPIRCRRLRDTAGDPDEGPIDESLEGFA